MTRLKEMILSDGNELIDLVVLSFIGPKVIPFEETNRIYRLCKNEFALELAQMETICYVI